MGSPAICFGVSGKIIVYMLSMKGIRFDGKVPLRIGRCPYLTDIRYIFVVLGIHAIQGRRSAIHRNGRLDIGTYHIADLSLKDKIRPEISRAKIQLWC